MSLIFYHQKNFPLNMHTMTFLALTGDEITEYLNDTGNIFFESNPDREEFKKCHEYHWQLLINRNEIEFLEHRRLNPYQ